MHDSANSFLRGLFKVIKYISPWNLCYAVYYANVVDCFIHRDWILNTCTWMIIHCNPILTNNSRLQWILRPEKVPFHYKSFPDKAKPGNKIFLPSPKWFAITRLLCIRCIWDLPSNDRGIRRRCQRCKAVCRFEWSSSGIRLTPAEIKERKIIIIYLKQPANQRGLSINWSKWIEMKKGREFSQSVDEDDDDDEAIIRDKRLGDHHHPRWWGDEDRYLHKIINTASIKFQFTRRCKYCV